MKRLAILLILAVMAPVSSFAQDDETVRNAHEKVADKDIIKTGLSFGPFPIVAYDAAKGLQLGALCNIYNFGSGQWYPTPKDQWYFEASFFTKGSQLFIINYDNKTLIPGVRFSATLNLDNDKGCDFYGFNGYDSGYVNDGTFEPWKYKIARTVPYFKADFTGKITKHLYWKAGYHFKYFSVRYFKGEGVGQTYLEDLVNAGVVPADQIGDGFSSSVRAGLMYDSRDFEPAPSKGIWAEASIEGAPGWLGTSVPYAKYYLAFRHYVPIVSDKLVFAFRLNWQGFIKDPAFYVLPYESQLGYGYDRDGFGGYRTIRGLARNRIQGRSICYYNTELRYRFIDFHVLNQNVGLAISAFCDGGRVLVPYGNVSLQKEKFHITAGGGFRIIINRNFIIAAEYGVPFNEQDKAIGKGGAFYVNTGFLF